MFFGVSFNGQPCSSVCIELRISGCSSLHSLPPHVPLVAAPPAIYPRCCIIIMHRAERLGRRGSPRPWFSHRVHYSTCILSVVLWQSSPHGDEISHDSDRRGPRRYVATDTRVFRIDNQQSRSESTLVSQSDR